MDRDIPPSSKDTRELVHSLDQRLAQGKRIAIHCRQGVGRAALLAACVLAVGGVNLASAWSRIVAARGCAVPDTREQRDWVARFNHDIITAQSRELGIDVESQ